jgi:uncharacterized protein
MKSSDFQILRIHLNSDEKHSANTIYESLVFIAKQSGLKHAMVQRALLGYKGDEEMDPHHKWKISQPAPVIVEIIDTPDKIQQFAADIRPLLSGCKEEPLVSVSEYEGTFMEPKKKNKNIELSNQL